MPLEVTWTAGDAALRVERTEDTQPARGQERPPGSKSLTNRALLCAGLADGASRLLEASFCDDTDRMAGGLKSFGIPARLDPAERAMDIEGCRGLIPQPDTEIDAGHAGTAMRFLVALATLGHGRVHLDGSGRMRERPIGALVDALTALGAGIGYDATPGCPPLTVVARGLGGGQVTFHEPPSSQFLSAVLMVAPYAARDVLIALDGGLPSRPYVDMTIEVMRSFGVEVLSERSRFVVPAGQRYQAQEYTIEPDASGATYLWAAAAITAGSVIVPGLTRKSLQGDTRFVDVLAQMGCTIVEHADALEIQRHDSVPLRGIDIDLNSMPDTVQTLAVAALFAEGTTTIRNVANLRVKETDRLAALQCELSKLGATVELLDDGLVIEPPARITPTEIDTYQDHRMAMSFALVGLVVEGMVIRDGMCCSKSYPRYFDALTSLMR